MPEIKEYLPQAEAQGPVGGTSPNLEAVTARGRGLERLGDSIEQGSDIINRANTQAEISDISAGAAKAGADFGQFVKDGLAAGTLDVDKLKQNYENYMTKMGQNLSTTGGLNYFNKIQARLGARLITSAIHGQAVQAGRRVADNWNTTLQQSTVEVANDPSQFKDVYDANVDGINEMIKANPALAGHEEKFRAEAGAQLSIAAVKGLADIDTNKAQAMLDHGAYDQYLNNDQKEQLGGYIKMKSRADDLEVERQQNAIERAKKAQSEKQLNDMLPGMYAGTTTTDQIMKSALTPEKKIEAMNILKQQIKGAEKSDPAVFNDVSRRVNLPEGDPNKIEDISQLAPMMAKGDLSIPDAQKVIGWMAKTPEGQALRDNRRRLVDFASAKLISKDPMLGLKDPDGEFNMSQFQVGLQHAEEDQRKAGKPVRDLYDPTSKSYFGNQIGKYVSTPEQILQKMVGTSSGDPGDPLISVVNPDGQTGKMKQSVFNSKYKDVKGWSTK